MRIRPGRLLLILFVLGFTLFFGLDLATRGMERVQGPRENAGKPAAVAHQPESRTAAAANAATGVKGAATAVKAGETKPAKTNEAKQGAATGAVKPSPAPAAVTANTGPIGEVEESFINHLCNRVGNALQKGAKALINLVVSIFDSAIN